MLWFVLILAILAVAFGFMIYRIDKNVKSKYEKKFNPHEWNLPGHIELPASIQSQLTPPSHVQPLAPAASVKVAYEKNPSVYSAAQKDFYKALQLALAGEFTLLTNIEAASVLAVVTNNNALATQVALNNLAAKQFAFVVCDKPHLSALCIVDLGNAIDAHLRSACESAQLPLVTINTQADYDSRLLREKILGAMGLNNSLTDVNNECALDIADEKPINNLSDNGINLVLCAECSAVMLKRKAKNGENAGKLFWLCSTYPKCRGMRVIK